MKPITDNAATKDAQVSVRIPAFVDEWLEGRAGPAGSKADVVRRLIEEEMAREEAEILREMFDAAAAELTEEEREDRDLLLGAFEPGDG
jgi:Arc/MetJ-type ribon-helix-helix transcriptional regulator